jgi:hypothetical protein
MKPQQVEFYHSPIFKHEHLKRVTVSTKGRTMTMVREPFVSKGRNDEYPVFMPVSYVDRADGISECGKSASSGSETEYLISLCR